jgi:hypothetical protein
MELRLKLGPERDSLRAFNLSPDQALGLLLGRAQSSCPAQWILSRCKTERGIARIFFQE